MKLFSVLCQGAHAVASLIPLIDNFDLVKVTLVKRILFKISFSLCCHYIFCDNMHLEIDLIEHLILAFSCGETDHHLGHGTKAKSSVVRSW